MLQIDQGDTGISCLHKLHHWCMLWSGRCRIFPSGAPNTKGGVLAYFFVKKCMEMKEFGPGGASLALPHRSANAVHPWSVHCECAMKGNKRCIFNYLYIRDMSLQDFMCDFQMHYTTGNLNHVNRRTREIPYQWLIQDLPDQVAREPKEGWR